MTTYRQIQEYVEIKYEFIPQTGWIAHVKEICNIPHMRDAPNRIGEERTSTCPPEKISCIKDALQFYGMI